MAVEQVDVLQVDTSKSVQSIAGLRKEIKQLKGELLGLQQGTKEYNELLVEVADKTHQLEEVQRQVNATSRDFGDRISNVQGTIAGLSGAFQTVLGSLSLMGVEMGDDVKMLKMLQSAMAITQGVAAIDSGVKAFRALTISIKASTVAMSGLKKALITSGIGAAAVAVGILVSKLMELADKEKEAAEETKKHNELLKEQKERYEAIFNATTTTAEQKVYSAKFWKEYGKARVDAVKSGIDAQTAQKKAVEAYMKVLEGGFDKERKFTEAGKKAWNDYFYWRVRSVPAANNELAAAVMKEIDNYGKEAAEKLKVQTKAISEAIKTQPSLIITDSAPFRDPVAEEKQREAELQAETDYQLRRAEIIIANEKDVDDQLLQLNADYRDKREELLRRSFELGLIDQSEFNNQIAALEVEAAELQIEQEERVTEKTNEELEKRKTMYRNYMKAIGTVTDSIASILSSIGSTLEQGGEEWKAIMTAEAIISTIKGSIDSFMSMASLPAPLNLIAGAAAAAATFAAGMAEVHKIQNTKIDKNGSASSTGTSTLGTVSASAVSVNATQVTPTRTVQTEEDVANLPDTRVYVLERDITNAQNLVRVTKENSTY